MEEHKISVIVPVYNVEKYLIECLDSIIKQTYANLEIILIDDGSPDGCGSICDAYKLKDSRIIVIHKENEGLGYARNCGLDIATGDYITFVDSDDYIMPTMIETLYNGLIDNQVNECKMGFQRVKNDHSVCAETRYEQEIFPGEKARTEYAPRLIGSVPDKHDSIEMCVCGAIFVGDIIRKNHLRFPSERELISEDLIFHLEYLQYAKGACVIENTDYKYRVNDLSLSKSYKINRKEMSIAFYEELIKRIKSYGYGEETVIRAKKLLFIYIRVCISQEVTYEMNSISKSIKRIKDICSDEVLQSAIQSYPIGALKLPQRVFVECLKHKTGTLLYILKKMQIY